MDTENIIAICAVFIAALSLGLTIYQSMLAREHNRIQVRPYLDLTWSSTDEEGFSCLLKNYGVGPAFIAKVNYFLDGKEYTVKSSKDFGALIREIGLGRYQMNARYCHIMEHSALSPSEEAPLFLLSYNKHALTDKLQIQKAMSRISIDIDYMCSYKRKMSSPNSSF
ncbi:hypothetical protein [Vibrio lentus]|uniref:hypothetical protein n=1 Tax=Vibrio lentus TaxID=136468 RepID=UPI000C8500D8|nr:hypothetical protein [Vibrio lentus]PMI90071.1 hypothetical protein BCU35_22110 [Vibrio lentus]